MSTKAKDLPRGWKEVQSKSRPDKVYFLHVKSGEKTWKLSHVHAKEREFRHRATAAQADKKKRRSADDSAHSGLVEWVQALHILVKHSGSRRPSSWRQENITRSKAVAEAKAGGIRDKLLACVEANPDRSSEALRELFEEIAKEESDCSSAKRGGDLGPFTRGKMTPSFEKAAFGLKVGDLSDLVESDSGVHIILRIA
ncbi:Peptidylprolyl cistrans isomerase NIMAinteracting 1 [Phytophthora megakarya]|uniref:Peptidyl-prolyl cis-trans isomerase n=1 Tax=Phytophthora megakarya TaxID=4795 RepID=A0A225WXV5_9STRA|nr:Peptidylprolyl cistrans isomerase NIMAinteracting 1 [Phytophthora megakarya]